MKWQEHWENYIMQSLIISNLRILLLLNIIIIIIIIIKA
jgi:hypothetical protein